MAPTTSRPWPPPSTADRARRSGGERPPRLSTRCCNPVRLVLRRPVETKQYAAEPYRQVLERHGIRRSMSRRGNCLDNAPMESFFASLKKEHVHHARFRSRAEARGAIFEYLEIFYNHSSQRTSRYVVAGKRFCWSGSDAAGCSEWLRARRATLRAAGPWRSVRLKSQGPSPRGCSASISPRSAASLSVRGATPTSAAARRRLSQGSTPPFAGQQTGIR